jgi:hypothetical protein
MIWQLVTRRSQKDCFVLPKRFDHVFKRAIVRNITFAASRDENLCSELFGLLQKRYARAQLPRAERGHDSSSAATDHKNIGF